MTESKVLAHSLLSKERSKDVILTENVSFASLILPPEILEGLSACGFEKPSPIQVKALPVGRCGFDLIVKSKSGTGKTLVFAIISLESIRLNKCEPQVLILAPTREIAVQIQEVIKSIGKNYEGLCVESFIGGLPLSIDKANCKSCHIAVGTPGRVKQLIQEGSLAVNSVKIFVLDEADKLTENSFQNDINEIYNSLPDKKQIITCSATYSEEVQSFLGQYMQSPVLLTVELETPLLLGLKQYVRLLKSSPNIVQQTKVKNDELLKIISTIPFTQCLVFSNYQNRAESISNFLNRNGWSSIFISAAQSQPERLNSLSNLKDFKCKILVTTDLTARGIDAANVDLVINYDVPTNATTYLHRMGRAGRYGATGTCINLTLVGQESKLLQNIMGVIGGQNLSIPILDESFNLDINKSNKDTYLFGEVADSVTDFKTYSDEIREIRSSVSQSTKVNTKVKSKKSKSKSPKESSIVKNKIEENLDDNDMSLVLSQLASGTFELNPNETNRNLNNKTDLYSLLLNPANESNKNEPKRTSSPDPNLLLQQLANEGEISSIKPSHTEKTRNETFAKNKALFNVAKVLSNVEVSNEDCSDLSAYLKSEENSEVRVNKNISGDEHISCEVLENIFSLAYKSQISKSVEKWQNLLPEKEKAKLSSDFIAEDDDNYDDYEETFDEEYYDEDYDFEIEKDVEVKYSNNPDDYSFMEWVPVEPQTSQKPATKSNQAHDMELKTSVLAKNKKTEDTLCHSSKDVIPNETQKYRDQYDRYFQHCSSNLWQNGLTFETVESFDRWFFNDWERQLGTVRDFVQKKVYMDEMSRYY